MNNQNRSYRQNVNDINLNCKLILTRDIFDLKGKFRLFNFCLILEIGEMIGINKDNCNKLEGRLRVASGNRCE